MRPVEWAVVYLLIGLVVATRDRATGGRASLWALLLWPLVLPGLLAPADAHFDTTGTDPDLARLLRGAGVPESDLHRLARGLAELDRRIHALTVERARHDPTALRRRRAEAGGDTARALEEQLAAIAALDALVARLTDRRDAARARIDSLTARLALHDDRGDDDVAATLRAVIAAVDEAGR